MRHLAACMSSYVGTRAPCPYITPRRRATQSALIRVNQRQVHSLDMFLLIDYAIFAHIRIAPLYARRHRLLYKALSSQRWYFQSLRDLGNIKIPRRGDSTAPSCFALVGNGTKGGRSRKGVCFSPTNKNGVTVNPMSIRYSILQGTPRPNGAILHICTQSHVLKARINPISVKLRKSEKAK